MESHKFEHWGWVTSNGQFGVRDIVVFNPDYIGMDFWDTLASLPSDQKYEYTLAYLDEQPVSSN